MNQEVPDKKEEKEEQVSIEEISRDAQRYKMIFDNVKDMVVFLDMKGRIIEANKQIKEIFGYEPEEVKGKLITGLGHFKIRGLSMIDSFKMIMGFVLGGKTINFLQLETKDRDGKTIFLEASTAILKKDGKNIGYLSITRDITERKKSEDAINERNRELERLNNLSVGRELKMIELKNKIKELEEKLAKTQGKTTA